jgi:hypothetical protein
MKRIVLLSMLFLSVAVFGQNKYKYEIQAYGGVTIGDKDRISDFAKNDSVKKVGKNLVTYIGDTAFYMPKSPYSPINVKDYGAIGDGITDDYTAIFAALTEAKTSGREVIFPEGYYMVGSLLSFNDWQSDFKLRGIGKVTIDFSLVPLTSSRSYFSVDYDTTKIGTVTADMEVGDTLININTTAGLASGDFVVFESEENWSTTREYYIKGEIHQVREVVDATSFAIYDKIYDDYDADSIITVFESANSICKVDNITFLARDTLHATYSQRLLSLNYFNNVEVKNCEFGYSDYFNLEIGYARNVNVHNTRIYDALRNGLGYGISIISCQDVTLRDNSISACRHTVTVSGTFPSRNVNVTANKLSSPDRYSATFDTHGACDGIIINDNFIQGGVLVRSPNTVVSNNVINSGGAGIQYEAEHYPRQGYLKFESNEIYTQEIRALSLFLNTDSDTLNSVLIRKNNFNSTQGEGVSILSTGNNTYIRHLDISDNVYNVGEDAIYLLSNAGDVNITKNTITVREANNPGINFQCDTAKNITVADNIVSTADQWIGSKLPVVVDKVIVKNNEVDQEVESIVFFEGTYNYHGNVNYNGNGQRAIVQYFANKQDTLYIPDGAKTSQLEAAAIVDVAGGASDTLVIRFYGNDLYDKYGFAEIRSFIYYHTQNRGDIFAMQDINIVWDEVGAGGIAVSSTNIMNFAFDYFTVQAGDFTTEYGEINLINNDAAYDGEAVFTIGNHKNLYKMEVYTK